MKKQQALFIIISLLVVLGCVFPLYEIDGMGEKCNLITTIALLFNTTIAYYIYTYHKNYINLVIIPQIVSFIFFILIWNDIADKFSLMDQREISYGYCIGFYLLLIGTFSSILMYILSIRVKKTKEKVKVKYTVNRETGRIKREEIH